MSSYYSKLVIFNQVLYYNMRERVSQMIHLYGHFRRHSFDQKEERKMGRRGRERERESEKGKERKIVRCRFKVIARDFCANFTSSVKELFPFTPRRLNNFSTSFIVPVPPPPPPSLSFLRTDIVVSAAT